MNCRVWGGVSFHWSYHLVSVIPPLLSTIPVGGGGLLLLIPTRIALLPTIGWGASAIPHAPTVTAFGVASLLGTGKLLQVRR